MFSVERKQEQFEDRWSYYETWVKILYSIAWATRYTEYLKIMSGRFSSLVLKLNRISLEELRNAERKLIRLIQMHHFADEYEVLCEPAGTRKIKKPAHYIA